MREIVLGDETRGRDKGTTILGKFERVEWRDEEVDREWEKLCSRRIFSVNSRLCVYRTKQKT